MAIQPFSGTAFDLTGHHALVTGAAGLLGIQHSIALAEAGATVVMTDINEQALEASFQRVKEQGDFNVITQVMDVTNPENVRAVQKSLSAQGIIIDRLINNAAIDPKVKTVEGLGRTDRLENFDIKQWQTEVAVGLTGAMTCASVFGSPMAEKRDGVILNIASDLSVFSPDQRLYRKNNTVDDEQPVKPVSYSVIKAGLVGLTRYLATYWADRNVRSNALSPGGVYAEQDEQFVTRLSNLIPLARMASETEYRGAIQFLCSDAAKYMNGQNVVMDGGRSVL
jgi:NAD(P)-dependent dehydrogenase (short-subunit alcohol dehydrogenase family)